MTEMAKVNPRRLKWSAPTTDVEGNPITRELSYNFYLDGQEQFALPGTLNPEGQFEAYFDQMSYDFVPGITYLISLTAFYVENPGLESDASPAIEIVFLAEPSPPFSLEAV